jgi:hypothetical protein
MERFEEMLTPKKTKRKKKVKKDSLDIWKKLHL